MKEHYCIEIHCMETHQIGQEEPFFYTWRALVSLSKLSRSEVEFLINQSIEALNSKETIEILHHPEVEASDDSDGFIASYFLETIGASTYRKEENGNELSYEGVTKTCVSIQYFVAEKNIQTETGRKTFEAIRMKQIVLKDQVQYPRSFDSNDLWSPPVKNKDMALIRDEGKGRKLGKEPTKWASSLISFHLSYLCHGAEMMKQDGLSLNPTENIIPQTNNETADKSLDEIYIELQSTFPFLEKENQEWMLARRLIGIAGNSLNNFRTKSKRKDWKKGDGWEMVMDQYGRVCWKEEGSKKYFYSYSYLPEKNKPKNWPTRWESIIRNDN